MNSTTEVTPVADEESNDFRLWMKSMGYNAKQVSAAGEVVGMSPSLAGHSSRGLRELTKTERLAMAAAMVGLPEWSPSNEPVLEAMSTVHSLLISELGHESGTTKTEAEALRTIKALIRSQAMELATQKAIPQSDDPETDRMLLNILRLWQTSPNER